MQDNESQTLPKSTKRNPSTLKILQHRPVQRGVKIFENLSSQANNASTKMAISKNLVRADPERSQNQGAKEKDLEPVPTLHNPKAEIETHPVVEKSENSSNLILVEADRLQKLETMVLHLTKQVEEANKKISLYEINGRDSQKSRSSLEGQRQEKDEKPEMETRENLNVSFPRAIDLAKHNERRYWKEIRGIKELGIWEKLNKNERNCQEAKFELMLSEANFLNGLDYLMKDYVENIHKHIQQRVITQKDYDILFKHILDVRECSKAFLEDLDKVWQTDPMLNGIYDVIIKHSTQHFSNYVIYCRNMLDMRNHLLDMTTTNGHFKDLLGFLITREGSQKLSLDSYLMSPMQRITRLPLLLKTILDKLDKDCEEYTKCAAAYDAVGKVTNECDVVVEENKQLKELIEMRQILEFAEDTPSISIVVPGRCLVSRAVVCNIILQDKSVEQKKIELVLFSDILLVCKKKSDKILTVVKHCPRDGIRLEEINNPTADPRQPKTCLLSMFDKNQENKLDLIVTFKENNQCNEWLKMFAVKRSKQVEPEPKQPIERRCKVIFSYEPQNEKELKLQKGDEIDVLCEMENGWSRGRLGDKEGIFPSTYVQELSDQPTHNIEDPLMIGELILASSMLASMFRHSK